MQPSGRPVLDDTFLAECGLHAPLTVTVEAAGGVVAERPLEQPFALVGRDARSTVCLDHADVSWCHAYVQVSAGRTLLIDLSPGTGLRWSGARRTCGWLPADCPVDIGPYRLRLRGPLPHDGSDTAPPAGWHPLKSPVPDASPSSLFTVELRSASGERARAPLRRALTLVGHGPLCGLRLPADRISAHHCSLVATPHGLWVVDLLSTEGVSLNGSRVRWARVAHGDRLQVGPHELRFWREQQPPADQQPRAIITHAPPPGTLAPPSAPPAAPPVPLDPGLVQGALRPYLEAQQQALDQFQQNVLGLIQMMMTWQQDQFGLIRKELEQIHLLSDEIRTLRGRPEERPPQRDPADMGERPSQAQADEALSAPPQSSPLAQEAAREAEAPRPPDRPLPSDDGPATTDGSQSEAGALWLCERLAELEKKRQGRWQKILGMLIGK